MLTLSIWASSSLFFGSYVIAEKLNPAIQVCRVFTANARAELTAQVQPHVLGTLCMVSWAQCQYYDGGYSARRAAMTAVLILCIAGAFETTSIFTLWVSLYPQAC
jgi:hypothetical protein